MLHSAFEVCDFERRSDADDVSSCGIFIRHRPEDAQVMQIYRIPEDPASADLERLTHFDIGAGRRISDFVAIQGDSWRGIWRKGGAIMAMDLNGNEMFQLWYVFLKWSMTLSPMQLVGVIGKILIVNLFYRESMGSLTTVLLKDDSSVLHMMNSDTVP